MPDLGIRLQLLLGPTIPLPASYAVMDALVDLEVYNNDTELDAFRMTFTIGKESPLDYGLLTNGYFDPPSRVVIIVLVNAQPQVLIDGIITHHQVISGRQPGQSRLIVTGDDFTKKLDLEPKSATFPNQSDSGIVTQLLENYDGLVPAVMETTDTPAVTDRVPSQQETDLGCIRRLAKRNGFVFYIEPTEVPTVNTAYWGPDNRLGLPQKALSQDMGPATNVEELNFTFDALAPVTPVITIVEPLTKLSIQIPLPSGLSPSLAGIASTPLRKTVPRDAASLSFTEAARMALALITGSSDSVTAEGKLDALRYGQALRSRRLVDVRGAGRSYDGTYYVQKVTHHLQRGQYAQSFTLKRGGQGATGDQVTV
jgi:hypothetical protein